MYIRFRICSCACALILKSAVIDHHCITQFIYEEEYIDVTENEEWFRRYRYDIPVLHLNGRLLMMHRVDEDKLKTALEELKNTTQ